MRPYIPAATFLFILVFFGFSLSAQTCTAVATIPTVHAEGYAERIGDYNYTCTGGTPMARVQLVLFAAVATNITNKLDSNGVPIGITVSGSAGVFLSGLTLYAPTTIQLSQVSYTVPALVSTPVTMTISGIRASAATVANGTTGIPAINGSALVIGAQYTAPASFPVALLAPTLLTSNINNGVPCIGSPVPATFDFPTFIATGTSASAIRVTEATATSFTTKDAGADNGLRILVKLSGYPAGSRVFVPDAIVGADPGATPTSTGLFNASQPSAGSYTPGNNQLLFIRVTGADATGTGGSLVSGVPLAATTFSNVSELTVTAGATYAVYEVADSNPTTIETAQIPVFVASPATACSSTTVLPAFSPEIAPVSTVSVATQTDPVPRFMAVTPGSDCMQIGDCMAGYFPTLSVSTTQLTFNSPSLGPKQQNSITVANSGGGILGFSVAVTYQTNPSGWLTVTPTSGQNTTAINVTADPTTLAQGTYNATIYITAGTMSATVPVTFNVGPVGVTIQNVGNAASFTYGTVALGSYAVIFGLNLSGNVVTATFNNVAATIVYKSAMQINLLVPTNLTQSIADVVVNVDGMLSPPFRVTLANDPGVFSNGVVNFADGQTNVAADPVTRGGFLVVYLTGLTLPLSGPVTVNIGAQTNIMPSFAGPQGTFSGLEQVNVMVPVALPATPNPVPLTVCIPGTSGTNPQPVCSSPINVYIQ